MVCVLYFSYAKIFSLDAHLKTSLSDRKRHFALPVCLISGQDAAKMQPLQIMLDSVLFVH
jgi:hypothetical protein